MSEFAKRAALFFIGVFVVFLGAWLDGFDFNKRGDFLLDVYIAALCIGVLLAAFPGIKGDA